MRGSAVSNCTTSCGVGAGSLNFRHSVTGSLSLDVNTAWHCDSATPDAVLCSMPLVCRVRSLMVSPVSALRRNGPCCREPRMHVCKAAAVTQCCPVDTQCTLGCKLEDSGQHEYYQSHLSRKVQLAHQRKRACQPAWQQQQQQPQSRHQELIANILSVSTIIHCLTCRESYHPINDEGRPCCDAALGQYPCHSRAIMP